MTKVWALVGIFAIPLLIALGSMVWIDRSFRKVKVCTQCGGLVKKFSCTSCGSIVLEEVPFWLYTIKKQKERDAKEREGKMEGGKK